jgi:hypothetical protein
MKQSTLNTLISAHRYQRFKSCDIDESERSGIRHLVRAGYLKRTGYEYQVSKLGETRLKMGR